MRMVGIQEDWEIVFGADASDDGGNLSSADESPLPFGGSDQHRHSQSARGCRHGVQPDEIGDVEMTDGGASPGGFRQAIAKALHRSVPPDRLKINESHRK